MNYIITHSFNNVLKWNCVYAHHKRLSIYSHAEILILKIQHNFLWMAVKWLPETGGCCLGESVGKSVLHQHSPYTRKKLTCLAFHFHGIIVKLGKVWSKPETVKSRLQSTNCTWSLWPTHFTDTTCTVKANVLHFWFVLHSLHFQYHLVSRL